MLFILPILLTAPAADAAINYLRETSELRANGLRPHVTSAVRLQKRPDFLLNGEVSIVKSTFTDEWLWRNFSFSISGNRTPSLYLAALQSSNWTVESILAVPQFHGVTSICGFNIGENQTCTRFTSVYSVRIVEQTTLDWLRFDTIYSPLDTYTTTEYCISTDGVYTFQSLDLTYDLPGGYRAGIVNFTDSPVGDLPLGLAALLSPSAQLATCFQIQFMRNPTTFLPLAVYTIAPLLTLYLVAAVTIIEIPEMKDRLQIYVGVLFAGFAYFLSLRQLLQTFISITEILVIIGMVLWIAFEAGKILVS